MRGLAFETQIFYETGLGFSEETFWVQEYMFAGKDQRAQDKEVLSK